jgi:Ca-activated chloride channel family protein
MVGSRRVFFLFLAASLLLCPAHGPAAQSQSGVIFVSKVELVQISVIVLDDKGAVATNLKKDNFRVFDNGIEQQLLYCERERQPVSFVILADQSSSMANKMSFVQEATLSVLDPELAQDRYHDEFSVFGIETRVTRLVPFTTDQQDLERRLPELLLPTNGSTALFDGIYWGVGTAKREAENKRRAVIIISDGGDNHSRYSMREVKGYLEEADVPVFAVTAGSGFEFPGIFVSPESKSKPLPGPSTRFPGPGGPAKSPSTSLAISQDDYIGPAERRGPHNLKALTEVTGGGVFTAHTMEDLPRIVRTIGMAVRYQYVLSFKPSSQGKGSALPGDGNNWHKLHVELAPKEKFAGYGIPYYKRGYNRLN